MVYYRCAYENISKQRKTVLLRICVLLLTAIEVYHKTEVYTSIFLTERRVFMPKLFTCEEVAERYSVQVITVWDWIRKKKLSAMKIGKHYRVTEDDIKAFETNARTDK